MDVEAARPLVPGLLLLDVRVATSRYRRSVRQRIPLGSTGSQPNLLDGTPETIQPGRESWAARTASDHKPHRRGKLDGKRVDEPSPEGGLLRSCADSKLTKW